jgi:hypothetical protein
MGIQAPRFVVVLMYDAVRAIVDRLPRVMIGKRDIFCRGHQTSPRSIPRASFSHTRNATWHVHPCGHHPSTTFRAESGVMHFLNTHCMLGTCPADLTVDYRTRAVRGASLNPTSASTARCDEGAEGAEGGPSTWRNDLISPFKTMLLATGILHHLHTATYFSPNVLLRIRLFSAYKEIWPRIRDFAGNMSAYIHMTIH